MATYWLKHYGFVGDEPYLAHHGIRGQRWGIKHGPPYPLNKVSKNKIMQTKSKDIKRPVIKSNLNKWGKSKDMNILWVTGLPGSGKSTLASKYAKRDNADYINIDLYTFKTADKYLDGMSKSFNKYLDAHVPNWKKMQKDAYSVLTKTDRRDKKLAGKWFDAFQDALENYGQSQYGKRKIVAEGIQILDETLFYNDKTRLKDLPLLIVDTSVNDSLRSRSLRDNKDLNKLLEPERLQQLKQLSKDLYYLKSIINQ